FEFNGQVIEDVRFSSKDQLAEAVERLGAHVREHQSLPKTADGPALLRGLKDHWGNELRYRQLKKGQSRISSDGPDQRAKTEWDV
ncbi:MAG: hypothetical protein GWO24_23350, partial [Akkermansiaceae bacterium]|nr:hypothetical protein [Akkermansiaceae bacterium]